MTKGIFMDSRSNSIKILILAEDQMNRFRLKRELYNAHYDVIVAENEEEGFQLATRIMPDLILVDWTTSPRSCSLLYEQLKNDPIMRSIPVIFLADRDNAAMMEAGLGLGTIDYVLRPYKLEELQACIRKVMGVRDEQRRLREEILQVKSNIMSMLEYKLRFPVTVIAGLAELINQQISHSNSWTQPDYVNGIIRQADHLKDLIDDFNYLLDSEQILEEVDLMGVVQAAVERFRKSIEEKKQTITVKCQGQDKPVVEGKWHHLFMAFRHLISNAHKFTHRGGTITVTITPVNGCVRIDVADTGIGISQPHQPSIFEKFNRGQQELMGIYSSLGLGLTIVKSVAEEHHGNLDFESKPGLGSHFWLDLPLSHRDSV